MIKFTVTTKKHGRVLEQAVREIDIADIVADYASEGDEPVFAYGWPRTTALKKRLPRMLPALEAELINFAEAEYQSCAPDLPREGYGHNVAAIEHIAGRLFDRLCVCGRADLGGHSMRIAKKALAPYLSKDEPRTTRRNELAASRALAKAAKERTVFVPKRLQGSTPKNPRLYSELAGYRIPMSTRPRRGVGSY